MTERGQTYRRFLERYERRKEERVAARANPLGRVWRSILAMTIVVVGLVLVPLPGPGWVIVFAGLFMLAEEFRVLAIALDRGEEIAMPRVERVLLGLRRHVQDARQLPMLALATFCLLSCAGAATVYVIGLAWHLTLPWAGPWERWPEVALVIRRSFVAMAVVALGLGLGALVPSSRSTHRFRWSLHLIMTALVISVGMFVAAVLIWLIGDTTARDALTLGR